MKIFAGILIAFLFFSIACQAQFSYKIRADSVRLYNDTASAELIIENNTKTVSGYLFNRGNGRTMFKKVLSRITDSSYFIGTDTLFLKYASVAGKANSVDWSNISSRPTNLNSIGSLANGTGWLYNNGSGTFSYTNPTKSTVGLSAVENTALSTWTGTSSLTTLGTITSGTWRGAAIADAYISSSANWDTAYNHRITSLVTTRLSGSAILSANVLDIPAYTIAGLGGQAVLNGTGFVKATGSTVSYDNSTYLTTNAAAFSYLPLAGGTLIGGLTGTTGTFSSTVTGSSFSGAGTGLTGTANGLSIGGNARYVSSPDGTRNSGDKLPVTSPNTVRFDFASASSAGTSGNYAGVMTYSPWTGTTASTGDASYQLAFGGTAVNGGGMPKLNIRKGIDSTWNSWYTIWHSGNLTKLSQLTNDSGFLTSTYTGFDSRYPLLTGKGASGTWPITITGSAGSLNGYANNQTGGANTIVQRDGNGYIQNSYFYSSGGGAERNGSGLGYVAGFNSSDYYIRSYNSSAVAAFVQGAANGTWGINVTGSAGSVAWSNVSGHPTNLSQLTNDLGLGSNAYSSTAYLPLAGGTLIGGLTGTTGTFTSTVTGSSFSGAGTGLTGTANGLSIGGTAYTASHLQTTVGTSTWNWSGQGGQPSWLWGGSDGVNMYVYNPSNFNVSYANSAGFASNSNTVGNVDISRIVSGDNSSKTSFFNDPNSDYPSGFYNQETGTNMPYSTWWHLIISRHIHEESNFQFQIAADFWSDNTYIRRITNNVPEEWLRLVEFDPGSNNITASAFNVSSDIRLKSIISRYPGKQFDMIKFAWKANKDTTSHSNVNNNSTAIHYGYVAQEVEKVYPDQVSTNKKGLKSVNYIEIHTKLIYDLQQKVAELEDEIAKLKSAIK